MPAAAIVTLVLAGVLVAALAFYLIWVIVLLASIARTLGGVADAIASMAQRTEPVNSLVDDINADLGAVADALDGTVGEEEPGGQEAGRVTTM